MKEHTPDALLHAWERWDDAPGGRALVVRLQDEINFAAGHAGMSARDFRLALVAAKKPGLSGYRDALKTVLGSSGV